MSIEQAQLERKLAERQRAAEEFEARIVAANNVQVGMIQQMLMAALKDLQVLQQRPSGKFDEVNLVAQKHARRIQAVVNGTERF